MPRIYLCFLWHMHQPFYKDLVSGEYRLPWTRLHALKDYYGMARLLEDFPEIRQTFNLVPSMMAQVAEYAAGAALEPLLQAVTKPTEQLSEAEQNLLLSMSFLADPARLIGRYPRFAELYHAWQASERKVERARHIFSTQALRDLQVLSQIAWFDEEFLTGDPEIAELVRKGRQFTLEDQQVVERKQREILRRVLPVYSRLAKSGQIEISTTPYYHPILPLLCDSDIAAVAHPGVPLPRRFRYPQDALRQLEMSRAYITREFGTAPAGLWPSEGSVSDEALFLAAQAGFEWAATDSGVLDRTLGRGSGVDGLYRPYVWRQRGKQLGLIFRDHLLSDLIGFVYSRMGAEEAAQDFLGRIRDNCRPIVGAGRDALVPIILDGENAWEYYDRNGRPFLRQLYRRISEDRQMSAVTVREAFARLEPEPLDRIFPGSWISANFDVWIGAEEDNKAWDYLLQARESYEDAKDVPPDRRELAFEELLIAEGSDWCWWYGPEHHSANRADFDQLFRDHLANAYRALGLNPPEELSRPILKGVELETWTEPAGRIRPVVDGDVTSYFEWLGAGSYVVEERSGAMHGNRSAVRALLFGTDGTSLFVRLDPRASTPEELAGIEVRIRSQSLAVDAAESTAVIRIDGRSASSATAECAFRNVMEARIPLAADSMRFQVSVWQNGLPLDAIPREGWLEVSRLAPVEWVG